MQFMLWKIVGRQSMRYIKTPLPQAVRFAAAAGEMETLEGVVKVAAGDAIVTGVEGEQWPIARARFEADYEAINPTRRGEAGLYRKRAIPVQARQTDTATIISLASGAGELRAQPGDWIITNDIGEQWVVAQTVFSKTYKPYDDSAVD